VTFADGAAATLILSDPADFTGTLTGLSAGDQIEFLHASVTGAFASGTNLNVTLATGETVQLKLAAPLPGGAFVGVELDGAGDSLVKISNAAVPAPPTYTLQEGAHGDWGASSSWFGGIVPDAHSNASIAGDVSEMETVTVSVDESVNLVTVNDASATLAVASGATLTVLGGLAVATAQEIDVAGSLVITGRSASIDNATLAAAAAATWWGRPSTATATRWAASSWWARMPSGSFRVSAPPAFRAAALPSPGTTRAAPTAMCSAASMTIQVTR
jgi:hypothetical protein